MLHAYGPCLEALEGHASGVVKVTGMPERPAIARPVPLERSEGEPLRGDYREPLPVAVVAPVESVGARVGPGSAPDSRREAGAEAPGIVFRRFHSYRTIEPAADPPVRTFRLLHSYRTIETGDPP
jgi:hypothetical protein